MAWNEPTPTRGAKTPEVAGSSGYLKTFVLMAGLIAVLAIGGNMIGGAQGMLLFGGLGLVMNFVMYWFSDRIALATNGAQPVTREQLPEVYEIVERLTRQEGMPMPRIYLIPSQTPNAFATGRNPEHAAVAVTEGILRILDRRQLEGVLAHELSHVKNRDVLIATVAAGIAGLIGSLGHMIQWAGMFGSLGSRDGDGNDTNVFGALAWAILAPIMAMLIQLAVSRSREYAADATGARMTGDPEPLAEALLSLEQANEVQPMQQAGPATAHLYIVNPLHGRSFASLLSTHPPIEERVKRLREMRRGVRHA
ncbi:MAG TPA: zinc metalloprotease HtpX [Anaeromyxobacteraceae bacterium]|nr:zinc metalloprotease HtpX [Anaeromyxobacteraceae bacterium]